MSSLSLLLAEPVLAQFTPDQTMLRELATFAGKAIVIYAVALVIVRVGKSRFLGKNTAFDMILGVMLGTVLARAINGDAPILGTTVAAVVLVTLHFGLSHLALHSGKVGTAIKGTSHRIIVDGKLDKKQLHHHLLTQNDLEEHLRLNKVRSVDEVEEARFERNGVISVVTKRPSPKVTDVQVENGVQTVRIEWH